jgi:hypothetical protein
MGPKCTSPRDPSILGESDSQPPQKPSLSFTAIRIAVETSGPLTPKRCRIFKRVSSSQSDGTGIGLRKNKAKWGSYNQIRWVAAISNEQKTRDSLRTQLRVISRTPNIPQDHQIQEPAKMFDAFNFPTSSRQLCGESSLRRDEFPALLPVALSKNSF